MRKRSGGFFIFVLACVCLLAMASMASAAVNKVICVPWQGDTAKHHTAISGTVVGAEPVPDSITFELINTDCSYGGTWGFFLNGTSLGTIAAQANCTCTPGLQTFAVTDASLLTSAWDTAGVNLLRAVLTGSTYVSWVRAVIVTGADSKTVCIYDYNGGSCGEENLCTAGYVNGPIDATVDTSGQPQPIARLKGVIKTTNTSPVWYKWVFGDGDETSVTELSGATKYNVEEDHTYTGAVGTPFTAQLMVDGVDNTMANAVSDNYLVKIEEDNLDAQVNIAIDNGLWRLYKWITYSDGTSGSYLTFNSQPCAVWNEGSYYFASPTASVIQAFMINNHKETGDPGQDPYVEAVDWGMNWLLNGYYSSTGYPMLQAYSIATQHGSDNPDTNVNGKGIEVRDYGYRPIYQGGMIMDAIIASGTPDADSGRDFDGNGANDTYRQVLQDMADMYAYGQCDSSNGAGSYYGGWRYSWDEWPDNSACQWAAIGMIPAQKAPWSCTVPGWVKTYNNTWLDYSHSIWTSGGIEYGGFGYTGPSYGDALTPSGMVQLDFIGAPTSDARWVRCERWLADNWGSWVGTGNMYAHYAFAKAMRLANPAPVETFASNGFNWYRGSGTTIGLAKQLVETQQADGQWGDFYTSASLPTAWGVIILKPVLFAAAPIACFTAAPNPTYEGRDITFNPSCSGHSETGKDIANLTLFEWDWDHDGVYDATSATPALQVHAFACASLPCTYPVTLRVTDDEGLTATYGLDIRITNPPHPPEADAGGPYMVSLCGGDSLTLDGSGSFDPNEGQHEAGCGTCPNDTITAWDWDLTPPLTGFNDKSGKIVTLNSATIASYFSGGTHNIGLRVTDNTALAYPGSGDPNLTDADFATVRVYDGCICNLAARAKALTATIAKVQLTWTHTGAASYDIYRSTEGPNTGFVLIADNHVTTYATYLDEGVVTGTTYYYRVVSSDGCGSNAASATPRLR